MQPTAIIHTPQSEPPSQVEFRALDIELPVEPVYDSHPWLLAGLVLVAAVLLSIAFAYVDNQTPPAVKHVNISQQ